MQRRHILAGQAHAHGVDDVLLRHAEQRRLGLIDVQHHLVGIVVDAVVDAEDVGRALEGGAHLFRHLDLARRNPGP